MKWIALNALGGSAWLAGLVVAKGIALPVDSLGLADHHILTGFALSSMGLTVLLWTNVRSAA